MEAILNNFACRGASDNIVMARIHVAGT